MTTGEVARLLGININTVIKWFDEGKIKGFRLPSSSDRRIPISALKSFMSENSIPMDLLEEDSPMRRMHERIPCDSNVRIHLMNGKEYGTYDASLKDLSLGGACVTLKGEREFSVPMNDCNVKMEMLEGPFVGSDMTGKVVRFQPQSGSFAVGMKFSDDSTAIQEIKKYIEKQN